MLIFFNYPGLSVIKSCEIEPSFPKLMIFLLMHVWSTFLGFSFGCLSLFLNLFANLKHVSVTSKQEWKKSLGLYYSPVFSVWGLYFFFKLYDTWGWFGVWSQSLHRPVQAASLPRVMKNAPALWQIIIVFFSTAESWPGDKQSGKQTALQHRAQSNCLPIPQC